MHEAAKRHLVAELAEGNARAARTADCPRCGTPCIVGDDHDDVAAVVRVDAVALNPVDEMLAIFDGRATFDLVRQGGKTARPGARCLYLRETWHVHNGRPAPGTVHAMHRCNPAARKDPDACSPTLFPDLPSPRTRGRRATH